MYATRTLRKGVPAWAQHMAKQPTKAGRLPPSSWSNAPPTEDPANSASKHTSAKTPGGATQASLGDKPHPAPGASNVPPTAWGPAGSDTRAWAEIRGHPAQPVETATGEPIPEGAKMAPKQEGPYGPKRDRSKGLMDSFRSLTPNQRILLGATFFVFGIGIYAYDQLVLKEEELEVGDDLRERLAKAAAASGGTSSEGLKVDDVGAVNAALAEARAAGRTAADEASAAGHRIAADARAAGHDVKAAGRTVADEASAAGHRVAANARAAGHDVEQAGQNAVSGAKDVVAGAKAATYQAAADAKAGVKNVAHRAQNDAGSLRAAEAAAAQVGRERVHSIVPDIEAAQERVANAVNHAVQEIREEAHHVARGVQAGVHEGVDHLVAQDAARADNVVVGEVPERTRWFGIRLRGPGDK